VEVFFSALIGYLCWRALQGDGAFVVASAIALGIAAGCRQSSILFLGPLWLFSLRKASLRQVCAGFSALLLTLVAWFFPMLHESGGAEKYFTSLLALWQMVPAKHTVLNSSITVSMARFFTILAITGMCFGGAVLLFFRPRRVTEEDSPQKAIFAWIWLIPGLLFFTFVFLNWVNSGYLLVLSPPVFAWLGAWAAGWYEQSPWGRVPKLALTGALAAANVAWFVQAPVYCSYRSVREAERELVSIRNDLNQLADSSDTLIVGFDSHFLGYRHAGYYLPQFLTVQYPELNYPQGARAFALERRDTQLLRSIPYERFTKFLLFPLPHGDAYQEYLGEVRQRFPNGRLVSRFVNGREFLSGSAEDLPLLFPKMTEHEQTQARR
jgi:hypothetical protein